ncbi:hypothetical protein [Vibrio phage MZH0603]|nr:hypothetical protein [Vibrio phage MZH0603]
MTVNTTSIVSGPYAGNGVADTFSYTFKIEDKSQLAVYETDDAGVETLLTVDVDYTVAGIGNDAGGTVARVAGALPNNYEWLIRSDYKYTQLTAFESQGAFFPDLHENAFDKLTFLNQQILDKLGRGPVVSDTYTGTLPLSLPNPVSERFLRWKSDLTGFDNFDIASIGALAVSDFAKTYLDELNATDTRAVLDCPSNADLTTVDSKVDAVDNRVDDILASSFKNALINSRFRVNQRGVSGTVVLAAGEYGHDRFRGGSSGCTYTFSSSGGVTTIDISAGTIEQEILASNTEAGSNVLSWSGTAQGRIDGGSYGDSGNVTATLDGTSNVTCEWNTGTLSLCQLEKAPTATSCEFKSLQQDEFECHYYFWVPDGSVSYNVPARKVNAAGTGAVTSSTFSTGFIIPKMRVVPTITNVTAGNIALRSESGGLIAVCTAVPVVSQIALNMFNCTFVSADVTDVTHIRFATDMPHFDAEL